MAYPVGSAVKILRGTFATHYGTVATGPSATNGYTVWPVGQTKAVPLKAASLAAPVASAVGASITKDGQSLVVAKRVWEIRKGVLYVAAKVGPLSSSVVKLEVIRRSGVVTVRQTNSFGGVWDLVNNAWVLVKAPPVDPPPVDPPPSVAYEFAVKGTWIVNSKGSRTKISGVCEWPFADAIVPQKFADGRYNNRDEILAAWAGVGINVVRTRVLADQYNQQNAAGQAAYVAKVAAWVATAKSHGLTTLICAWDALDGRFDDAGWAAHFDAVEPLYTAIFKAIGNVAHVLYEPVNEPNGVSDADWLKAMTAYVAYFRGLGYKGPLVIDPNDWANSGPGGGGLNAAGFASLIAQDAKLIGTAQIVEAKHDYANEWNNAWKSSDWIAATGGANVTHPILETEIGNYNGSDASVNLAWSTAATAGLNALYSNPTPANYAGYAGQIFFLGGSWFDANALGDVGSLTYWGKAAIAAIGGGTTPPPKPTPSPDGTTVGVGGQIVLANGDILAITQAGVVTWNGANTISSSVTHLFVLGTRYFQQTALGFWGWLGSGWGPQITDPRVVTPPPVDPPPVDPPPVNTGGTEFGMGFRNWQTDDQAAQNLLHAPIARFEVAITNLAAGTPWVQFYRSLGMTPQPLISLYEVGGTPSTAQLDAVVQWAKDVCVPNGVKRIEKGNEDYGGWFYGESGWATGGFYSRAANAATSAKYLSPKLRALGIEITIPLDDANTGSPAWHNAVAAAVPDLQTYVRYCALHPYGSADGKTPILQTRLDRNYTQMPVAWRTTILTLNTELGLASDNGRNLDDNYGWPTNMTDAQAAAVITQWQKISIADKRVAQTMFYQSTDQAQTGTENGREAYFGQCRRGANQSIGPKGPITAAAAAAMAASSVKMLAQLAEVEIPPEASVPFHRFPAEVYQARADHYRRTLTPRSPLKRLRRYLQHL